MKEYIQDIKLSKYDDVIHLYTKKPFFVDMNNIDFEETYEKLEKMANYKFDKLVISRQKHSTNVCVVDVDTDNIIENNDGLITNLKGVALLTVSADCQSIFLYDPINKVIGNIHSGWKGTLNKIIVNAIDIMINEFSCNPKNIIAVINPSIQKCCFEVDEDVVDNFKLAFDNIDDLIIIGDKKEYKQKYYIDLLTLNKRVMISLGLKEENISISDICTKCHNDLFNSYRANDKYGRNIALIGLKK